MKGPCDVRMLVTMNTAVRGGVQGVESIVTGVVQGAESNGRRGHPGQLWSHWCVAKGGDGGD